MREPDLRWLMSEASLGRVEKVTAEGLDHPVEAPEVKDGVERDAVERGGPNHHNPQLGCCSRERRLPD